MAGGSEDTSTNRVTERDPPAHSTSVVALVDRILEAGSRCRASDIHLEPHSDALIVRFRIDGSLIEIDRLPIAIHGALISRLKIMAGMNIVERRRPQDGQFSATFTARTYDVRLATLSTIHGEKMVLRLLDQRRTTRTLNELGMSASLVMNHRQLLSSPFGLVLCAGPTGSGKTTTLYASLMHMDIADRNVTTIEDPVEYVMPGINQVRTNDQAGLTFASGLRALLRQDPDIILIGELRDEETARLGVQAALTGHFVLSSIHATDAAGALQRLIDMGVEPFLVSSSLIGVIGQRLVRRICPSCSHPHVPSADELQLFENQSGRGPATFRRGTGCDACSRTGFLDRVGVYEILRMTPEMRRLLARGADADEIHRRAVHDGMTPIREAAMHLVGAGITTVDEVIRALGSGVPRTARRAAS